MSTPPDTSTTPWPSSSRDVATGRLTFVQVLKDGVGGVDGLYGADSVTVSPDGSQVYATGYYDDALAVFPP